MPDGGCYCGAVKYKYTGEVQASALCHCRDCQKISGSSFSTNIIVPGDGFSVTSGKPKEFTVRADSGNDITSYFCGDCGTTMFRAGATFGDARVIKVGTLDDDKAVENAKPGVELFAPTRPSWLSAVKEAGQKQGMPNSEDV